MFNNFLLFYLVYHDLNRPALRTVEIKEKLW